MCVQIYLSFIKDQSQGSIGVSGMEVSSPKVLTPFAPTEVFEPSLIVHPFEESFPVASADPQPLAHPPTFVFTPTLISSGCHKL